MRWGSDPPAGPEAVQVLVEHYDTEEDAPGIQIRVGIDPDNEMLDFYQGTDHITVPLELWEELVAEVGQIVQNGRAAIFGPEPPSTAVAS